MEDENSPYRWSVRLPRQSPVLSMLHEVQETSGLRMAELLEEAVTAWYEALPEVGQDDHDSP